MTITTYRCERDRSAWRNLFGKCVSVIDYANFFLSDKKIILLKCVHMFFMCIFRNYAHLGVSIQHFFYAIIQNTHKNRWMEMQQI